MDEIDVKSRDIIFKSQSFEWPTPDSVFKELDKEFNFTLDPCATKENAKCKNYFTIKQNGLEQEWTGNVFMNPPYGRDIGKWVKKAYESDCLAVCLLPSRTCTKWFHDYCMRGEIRFIKGRLTFGRGRATFPSIIVIFE